MRGMGIMGNLGNLGNLGSMGNLGIMGNLGLMGNMLVDTQSPFSINRSLTPIPRNTPDPNTKEHAQ